MRTSNIIFMVVLYVILPYEVTSKVISQNRNKTKGIIDTEKQYLLESGRLHYRDVLLHKLVPTDQFENWLINEIPLSLLKTPSGEPIQSALDRGIQFNANHYLPSIEEQGLSDGVDIAWVRHYNLGWGPSDDRAASVTVDSFGNVYVTGHSGQFGTKADYTTFKYKPSGELQWIALYNGPANSEDRATALAVDKSGNVYVTGYSAASNIYPHHDYDYVTIKYDSSGVQQWVARYDGPGYFDDQATAIALDDFGNVFVTGFSVSSFTYPPVDLDCATIKYNSSGLQQWVARYNGPISRWDIATDIEVDSYENVYVTGYSEGNENYDFVTIKYNINGIEQWASRYNGLGDDNDISEAIAIGDSGKIYITGRSVGDNLNWNYTTIQYNSIGEKNWEAYYNGPTNSDDGATALTCDFLGNVIVTGWSWGAGTGWDYVTIKYNSGGVEKWVERYDGPTSSNDSPTDINIDNSGNIYITGWSEGISLPTKGKRDYATVKYNSSGMQLWVSRYDGLGEDHDEATALAVDGSGNVYVTGQSYGSEGTMYDYATIKYSSEGKEEWIVRYNGPEGSPSEAIALAIDSSKNVYVTGTSDGGFDTRSDYTTIKYNTEGIQMWAARYNELRPPYSNAPSRDNDKAKAIAVDDFGNIYVTGWSWYYGTNNDYVTIKYNSDGVEQWIARYNAPENFDDEPAAITVDFSGNVYVTGWSKDSSERYDYATVKYNSEGIQQWITRYNGPGNGFDEATAITVDDSGNVFVTGKSYSGIGPMDYYTTIKYNSAGVEQWVAHYNGPGNNRNTPTAITLDISGNIYVTGWSTGAGTSQDYATIMYNSIGKEQWVARYNGSGNGWDEATDLAVDGSGNVYVTGWSYDSDMGYDYVSLKYNKKGENQWIARYNGLGNGEDKATALALDASGNIYVTGWSLSSSKNSYYDYDYATIKYNSSGVKQWFDLYNGPGSSSDKATDLAVDISGNVYVTGTSSGQIRLDRFYTTVKYVQNPVAIFTSSQQTLDFGSVDVGSSSSDSLNIINQGTLPLSITLVESDHSEFFITPASATIPPDSSRIFQVIFQPTTTGEKNGHILFHHNTTTSPDCVIVNASVVVSLIEEYCSVPKSYALFQNYPNPFNPSTSIKFQVPQNGRVIIKVYNILGEKIIKLVDDSFSGGNYITTWDGQNYLGKKVNTGIYFYRMESKDFVDIKKCLFVK